METPLNIPGYKIKKELGSGGMSRVYLAFENKLKRPVALKVLLPHLANNSRIKRRFIKEARTAAQLRHSNIVSIYDVGKEKDSYYISMEYLKESLKDRLRRSSSLKPEEALHIVKETAKALSYAHRKGFIHRDIKPDNIMFREDGAIVLVDFGIVKVVKSATRLTKTGVSIGTPKYMSPEQVRASRIDGRADIYSLGIVLYEALVGRAPYKAEDVIALAVKHAEEPVPQLPSRLKCYQPLIDKMLAKAPKDRVKNAEGVIRLIDAINFKVKQEKEAAATKSIKTRGKPRKPFLKYFIIILAAAGLVAGCVFLIAKFFI
jgi:serine/threonine-protein kinase PpkA